MPRGLRDRVAVVSGAAAGIGRAYARRLAEEGVQVVLADLEPATETGAAIAETGSQCLVQQCDVSSPDDVQALARAAEERFGRVDILVNNAGIYPFTPWASLTLADWRRIQSVNVESVLLMSQAFLPGMRERGWGRVVNVTSGSVIRPPQGMVPYVSSKMAIIGLTRALAMEVGQSGVTVNCIAPGLIPTNTVEQGEASQWVQAHAAAGAIKRIGRPEDLVGALAFLVSDDAAFMTGQTLLVDGGRGFL